MLQILIAMLLVLTATVAYAAPVDDWRADKPCGERMPDFQKTSLAGCGYASCSVLPDHSQICICEKQQDEPLTTVEQITADGQRTQLITANFAPLSYEDNAVLLHKINTETQGKNQLLLGIMATESNGIAIQRWQVWAMTDHHVSKPIMIHDYGALSFMTQANNEKTCQLLVAQLLNGWEPKLGDGWYVAGHWYEVLNGEFFASSRPTIYHRFLDSFAEKRGIALFDHKYGKQPFLWYKEPHTHTLIGPDVFNYQDIFRITNE